MEGLFLKSGFLLPAFFAAVSAFTGPGAAGLIEDVKCKFVSAHVDAENADEGAQAAANKVQHAPLRAQQLQYQMVSKRNASCS